MSRQYIVQGVNDLQSQNPDVAAQWHPVFNGTLLPKDVGRASGTKFWWICSQGHEWEATPQNRTNRGSGCPYCSGRRVVSGKNDLLSRHPDIAAEWNYSKNGDLLPSQIARTSKSKVWWTCPSGHDYLSVVYGRTVSEAGCPVCAGDSVVPGINDLATLYPEVASQWNVTLNELLPTTVSPFSHSKFWWTCGSGHSWFAVVSSRTYGAGCPRCSTGNVSGAESELAEWIESLGVVIERNTRRVIRPKEIDIFIPSHDLAIEFNGLYWHDSNHVPTRQHFEKWSAANHVGVQLITVWEDDWHEKPELVKSMLRHKLGLAGRGIGARKTKLVQVDSAFAREFFEKNHIQGFGSGSMYIGLEFEGELVALSSFKKYPDHLELIRYATSRPVVGGHSKILKSVLPLGLPIHTFADHEVSDGNLYTSTGWVADREIPPDYKYVYQHRRQHKFGFRLKRFKADPDLLFEEGMTEAELATLNGIPRVYDSGKTRYVFNPA